MYDYLLNTEMARLTLILGIIISTLIYKRTGLTMGGVITTGYLALFIGKPSHIITTMFIAYFTYYIVENYLVPRYMLAGRKRFEFEVLIGLVLQIIVNLLLWLFSQQNPDTISFYGIGFVLPGVIAHDMGRHGIRSTIFSTLLGILIISLIILPISRLQEILPDTFTATVSPLLRSQPNLYGYPMPLLPLGIILSVIIGLLVFKRFKTRTGGFVTAGYLALFLLRPLDLLFIIVSSALTFLIVNITSKKLVLVFGRTKLGFVVLTGVVVSWLMEILVINLSQGLFAPWSGFVIIMPMIVSLLANDFERQGVLKTMQFSSLATLGVFILMQLVVYTVHLLNLDYLFIAA